MIAKIVTLTDVQRDEFRKLRDAEQEAAKAFARFKAVFEKENAPEKRRYAPFEKITTTYLDEPLGKSGGTCHAYFEKELE